MTALNSQLRFGLAVLGVMALAGAAYLLGKSHAPVSGTEEFERILDARLGPQGAVSSPHEIAKLHAQVSDILSGLHEKVQSVHAKADTLQKKMDEAHDRANALDDLVAKLKVSRFGDAADGLVKEEKKLLLNGGQGDGEQQQGGGLSIKAEIMPRPVDVLLPGQIRARITGDCMDGYDPMGGAINYMCFEDQPGQRWRFVDDQLQTITGFCMDATGGKENDVVRLLECRAGKPGQKWTYQLAGPTSWYSSGYIVNKATGLCLTPPDPRSRERSFVRLQQCVQSCRQLWLMNAFAGKSQETMDSALTKSKVLPSFRAKDYENKGGLIACWIMTNPKNHKTKAVTVRDTWGRHCDLLKFVTTKEDEELDTLIVDLGRPEERDLLWKKSKFAWMHAYSHWLDKYDWIIRGDDDTYMLFDNLRDWLHKKNPNEPHYYGRHFDGRIGDRKIPFYSGGPGTILSKEALRRLGDAVLNETADNPIFNTWDTFADDMELGVSMARVGVPPKKVLDSEGRQLFMGLGIDAERVISRKDDPNNWFWNYSPESKEGMECCSKKWIGTHYVTPANMKNYEDLHLLGCEGAGQDPE